MQLQVTIEDIEYCIKHPVQIGVQYSNPIERAIRRDFRLADNVVVEAYVNQAIISWPPRTKDSKRTVITVSYDETKGRDILQAGGQHIHPSINNNLIKNLEYLSFDLCPSNTTIFKNIITKQHLKDFYKYCED